MEQQLAAALARLERMEANNAALASEVQRQAAAAQQSQVAQQAVAQALAGLPAQMAQQWRQ